MYPDGEIPVRGQIAVEAPGAEDEWFVGVFGEVITFVIGASPKTGFIGSEFGQVNGLFVRQNKMAAGTATPEEAADYQKYWNDRAIFVLDNADMDGFFTVTVYEE